MHRIRLIAIFALLLVFGCKARGQSLKAAQPALAPPNPVYIVDNTSGSSAKLLGDVNNPLYTTGTGGGGSSVISGTVTAYQGDGGALSNAWAFLQTDGTNVLGITAHPVIGAGAGVAGTPAGGVESVQGVSGGTALPADTVPGNLLNSIADQTSAGVQFVVKSSSGTFVGLYACNEGAVTGWIDCYDMAAADAGGVAGTAPKFMGLRIPSGACQNYYFPRLFSNGLICYSSSTVSTLTTAGAPNFTATAAYR